MFFDKRGPTRWQEGKLKVFCTLYSVCEFLWAAARTSVQRSCFLSPGGAAESSFTLVKATGQIALRSQQLSQVFLSFMTNFVPLLMSLSILGMTPWRLTIRCNSGGESFKNMKCGMLSRDKITFSNVVASRFWFLLSYLLSLSFAGQLSMNREASSIR